MDTSTASTPTPEPIADAGPNCAESSGSAASALVGMLATKIDGNIHAAQAAFHRSYPGDERQFALGQLAAWREAEAILRDYASRLPNISSQRTRPPMPAHQQTEAPTQEQRPGSL